MNKLLALACLVIALLKADSGSGPLIEERLTHLRENSAVSFLAEVPTDLSVVPPDWLAIVSWNVQVGGVSTSQSALRPVMVADVLQRLYQGSYQLLAAQEVSGSGNSAVLRGLLPGGEQDWIASFVDTTDTQDNGFWFRRTVDIDSENTLFATSTTDGAGRIISDPARAVHPPRSAHFRVNNFDFTLIVAHLTFAGGNTQVTCPQELYHFLS